VETDSKITEELYKRFKQIIDEYAPHYRSFLLAVSGGVDSVTMLDLFKRLRSESNDIRIGVATYNHKLRPEADKEVEFVRDICICENIPFYTDSGNVIEYARLNKLSTEEAARELRYSFLEATLKEHSYELIVTAHNANDLLETMILRFAKGTGPFGLAGLKVMTKNRFRPLLFFTRHEIEEYARIRNLRYAVDLSNFNENYERNFIRLSVVPLLRRINPRIEHAAISLAQSTWHLDNFVEKNLANVQKYLVGSRLIFKLDKDSFLQKEQIRRTALEFFGRPIDKEKIDRFSNSKSKSYKVSFWGNLGIEVSHGWVMMGDIKNYENYCYDFIITSEDGNVIIRPKDEIEVSGYFIKFEVSGIILSAGYNVTGFKIRNWIEGDRTYEGKKLKDIFNDKKVPTFLRRLVPLVVIDERVVYVPDIYKSRFLENIGLRIVSKGGINFES